MRKVIIITLMLILAYCSSPRGNHYFEMPVLKKIAQLSSIEPPPAIISFPRIYVIGTNDSISESSFIKLKDVYNVLYKKDYPVFNDFLFDALNQKIKIDTKNSQTYLYYSQTFFIDPNINHLHKEKGIQGLIDKYCHDSNGFYTLNKGALTLNEINSISYYFFINQYIRADDDYNATINFRKLSSVLK